MSEQPSHHTLHHLNPSKDLLGYYRARFDQFEKERQEYLDRIEQCRPSTQEYYDMKREVRQMEEENRQMRIKQSETKKEMGDLRDQMLRLRAENDELKISELEDRKRIRVLLETAGGDYGSKTTVFTDRKPEPHKEQFTLGQVDLDRYMKPKAQRKEPAVPQDIEPVATNEANESLLLQIGSLRAHVEDQQRLHEQRIVELLEDRAQLIRTMDIRAKRDEDRMLQFEERASKLETLLHNMTQDYCKLRHHYHKMERKLVEEVETLRTQYDQMATETERSRHKLAHVGQRLAKEKDKDVERLRSVMQQQVQTAEQRAATLQNKLDVAVQESGNSSRKFKERIKILESRSQRLDSWRKKDGEGYRAEIAQLQTELGGLEDEVIKSVELDTGKQADLLAIERCITSSKQAQKMTRDLRKVREMLQRLDGETFALI